jgi:hypothetical protein
MLIHPNPGYLDKNLPSATPQFFTVAVREEPERIASRELASAFLRKFKFEPLKQMLGK